MIFATNNTKKLKEARSIFEKANIEIKSLDEAGIILEDEIIEDGETYEENALIKAKTIYDLLPIKEVVFADDSGIEIDFLDGELGIHSKRFMGENTKDEIKNEAILEAMEDASNRGAKFVCYIACILENGDSFTVRSEVDGTIATSIRGDNGFGYDPIFLVDGLDKTYAQLNNDEKNAISHRARALFKLFKTLEND